MQCYGILADYCNNLIVSISPVCWINQEIDIRTLAGRVYSDAGIDYCFECAEKLVTQVSPFAPEIRGNIFIDREYGHNCDGSATCEVCGALLDYSLTDHGLSAEIDHFQNIIFTMPLSEDDAFAVTCLLDAAEECPEVIAIAERAVAAIPSNYCLAARAAAGDPDAQADLEILSSDSEAENE